MALPRLLRRAAFPPAGGRRQAVRGQVRGPVDRVLPTCAIPHHSGTLLTPSALLEALVRSASSCCSEWALSAKASSRRSGNQETRASPCRVRERGGRKAARR